MRWVLVAVMAALVGCSAAPEFTDRPLNRRSGDTQFRVDDQPGGAFVIYVRQDVYRFVPQPGQTQEDCRREALALAVEEGRRRGLEVEVDQRTIRTGYGRDGVSGMSTCTGQATAVPRR